MDNDDFRRGLPTSHRKFGEDIAILAGDALLTYAFEVLAQEVHDRRLVAVLVKEVCAAVGSEGMIAGQVLDMHPELAGSGDRAVMEIHARKTAALICCAVRCGAMVAGASDDVITRLSRFGQNLGLAFQAVDDVLDVTSGFEELGKRTGKDQQAGKLTYPGVFGLDESRRRALRLIGDAVAELEVFGPAAEGLKSLAQMLAGRIKG
jgi:geranylgeranyl diphosphate synthase type II